MEVPSDPVIMLDTKSTSCERGIWALLWNWNPLQTADEGMLGGGGGLG
jgi:hypothetical protein